jgi:hypothetical protein
MDIILKSRLQMKVPAFLPESLSFGLGKINLDCFLLALAHGFNQREECHRWEAFTGLLWWQLNRQVHGGK